MRQTINYRGVNKSEALEEHLRTDLSHLEEYFPDSADCLVKFKREKKVFVCEITIHRDSDVFRVEKSSEDMYKAIDVAIGTLWGKIRKYKSKIDKNRRKKGEFKTSAELVDAVVKSEDSVSNIKYKSISPKPMLLEEAIAAMEMIGHEFYAYVDADSNKVCVIYRRDENKHGKQAYGCIQVNK